MLALPNKRCGKILSILLKINESITIKDLASQFDVSARTIRNDLNQLEIWLKERSIELVKKPGVGIWLNIKSDSRRNLLTKISKLERYKDPILSLIHI